MNHKVDEKPDKTWQHQSICGKALPLLFYGGLVSAMAFSQISVSGIILQD